MVNYGQSQWLDKGIITVKIIQMMIRRMRITTMVEKDQNDNDAVVEIDQNDIDRDTSVGHS